MLPAPDRDRDTSQKHKKRKPTADQSVRVCESVCVCVLDRLYYTRASYAIMTASPSRTMGSVSSSVALAASNLALPPSASTASGSGALSA